MIGAVTFPGAPRVGEIRLGACAVFLDARGAVRLEFLIEPNGRPGPVAGAQLVASLHAGLVHAATRGASVECVAPAGVS